MTILYHGTGVDEAFKIAEAGAIMSPLEQQRIVMIDAASRNNQTLKEFIKDHHKESVEDVLLRFASTGYGEYEIEHRVKSVSFSPELSKARDYAKEFEKYEGCIVLGLDVDDSLIDNTNFHIIYIPGRINLENSLKEIYISPKAVRLNFDNIHSAFDKYNPEYFILDKK